VAESEVTASAVIAFAEKLEEDSSVFYQKLAEVSPENKELFLTFANEGKKNEVLIVRTYRETITDALEACFCFKGVDLKGYHTDITIKRETEYPEALRIAIRIENEAVRFYSEAAEASKNLLATIPRAFAKVAENRRLRRLKLEALT
jgi:rubrerythrin